MAGMCHHTQLFLLIWWLINFLLRLTSNCHPPDLRLPTRFINRYEPQYPTEVRGLFRFFLKYTFCLPLVSFDTTTDYGTCYSWTTEKGCLIWQNFTAWPLLWWIHTKVWIHLQNYTEINFGLGLAVPLHHWIEF
jgi:hypothetical protein